MNVKLNALINAREGFDALLDLDLPIKTSYRITKIAKEVQSEYEIYEEKRNALVKKYGGEVEERSGEKVEKVFKVLPENMEKFITEHNELASIEVELNFDPINLTDLGENVKIKPKYLYMLENFIVVDE